MRRAAPLVALATLAALLLPAAEAPGGSVVPWTNPVDGATGWMGVPAEAPKALLLFCHGLGHTASKWAGHLQAAADRGYLAVAMDYSPRFDEIALGAARTNAAALHLADTRGIARVVPFGVSMGGAVCGLAAAEAPQRADGRDLYDVWFDVEGVTMQAETWAEAKLVGHPAAGDIERENGGTPADAPAAYVRRSAAMRAPELREKVAGVVIVHAVNDGLVPYNQGRELAAALRAAAVPTDMYTVLRGDPSDLGTTGTGALGVPNPAGLAGHATETSSTHPVMRTAFDRLWAYLEGGPAPLAGEFVVDEGLGRLP